MHSQHDTHTEKIAFPSFIFFATVRCGFGRWVVDRSLVVLFWWFFYLLVFIGKESQECIVRLLYSLVRNDGEQAISVESDMKYWVLIFDCLRKEKTEVSIDTFSMNSSSCTCWFRCFFLHQVSSLIHYAVESSTSFLNFINKYHVRSLLVHVLLCMEGRRQEVLLFLILIKIFRWNRMPHFKINKVSEAFISKRKSTYKWNPVGCRWSQQKSKSIITDSDSIQSKLIFVWLNAKRYSISCTS